MALTIRLSKEETEELDRLKTELFGESTSSKTIKTMIKSYSQLDTRLRDLELKYREALAVMEKMKRSQEIYERAKRELNDTEKELRDFLH